MYSNLSDTTAIAQAELNSYLKAQVSAIAPELIPLVPVPIKVERVGFTRNASRTPYVVYTVGDRRCCTFIKRRVFFDLVRALLRLKYGIEDRIRSIVSSAYFGLSITTTEESQYIPSSFVAKFFESYNQAALEKTIPQKCDCNDLFEMCLHAIVQSVNFSAAAHT